MNLDTGIESSLRFTGAAAALKKKKLKNDKAGGGKRALLEKAQRAAEDRKTAASGDAGSEATAKAARAVARANWEAALARASGEKVLDDPRLLAKSLKREAKEKAKRSAAWAERKKVADGSSTERQARREANLASRTADKMARKKARREKKLLRPGFEGRRAAAL